MASSQDNMELFRAADRLRDEVKYRTWVVRVGVSSGMTGGGLVVFVRQRDMRLAKKALMKTWEGWTITIESAK